MSASGGVRGVVIALVGADDPFGFSRRHAERDRIGDEGMTRVGVHGRVLCDCVADAALAAKQLLSAR